VGARYYDPQVGRFISRDTVLSEHPYLYCEHEPVMRVDPSGHFDIEAAIVGTAIGAATAPPGLELPYAYWGFIGGGWEEGDFARIGKIPNSRTNPGMGVPEDLPFWQDVARRVNDWVKRFWDDIKKYQRPIDVVGIERRQYDISSKRIIMASTAANLGTLRRWQDHASLEVAFAALAGRTCFAMRLDGADSRRVAGYLGFTAR